MAVIQRGHDHTVMVTFSARRFKTFLFAARKKLRRDNEAQESELFVNENLTQYNISLLKLLNTEKKKRIQMGTNSFSSVFSFDRKIYVKTAVYSEKMHIKNKEACPAFIGTLDGDSVAVAGDRTITGKAGNRSDEGVTIISDSK